MHKMMEKVNSYNELLEKVAKNEKSFLLLYKPGSEHCDCAFQSLEDAWRKEITVPVFSADVSKVKDIHTKFGITTVPSLMIFAKGEFENLVKGCHDSSYYKSLMENAVFQAKAAAEGKTAKRVTVYSTPTCSWCNTLKNWLRKNHINFSDIDVSRNEKASEEMVRRTGQRGVPQTDVNGQMVVGFNELRLKELLEIK